MISTICIPTSHGLSTGETNPHRRGFSGGAREVSIYHKKDLALIMVSFEAPEKPFVNSTSAVFYS